MQLTRTALVALAVLVAPGCRKEEARPRPTAPEEAPAHEEPDPDLLALRLRPDLAERKIHVEKAKRTIELGVPAVRLDVRFEAPYRGTLWIFALDGVGKEIGRSRAEVDQAASSHKSIIFLLDKATPIQTVQRLEVAGT